MKKVKITAVRAVNHSDLSAIYENAIEHTCDVKVGDVFISEDAKRPDNLCESAWQSMKEFVEVLAKKLKNSTGNFDAVYTHKEEGRMLILKCRANSYISANEKSIGKKYKVSHWE